jgi:hypothetical protein
MVYIIFFMKRCRICHNDLGLESFYRDKQNKDGYSNDCKECRKESSMVYRKKVRKSRVIIKKEISLEVLEYRHIKKLERQRRHYLKHRDNILLKNKKFREGNPDKVRMMKQKYTEENRDKLNDSRRVRETKRRYSDPTYKLIGNIRRRINRVVKNKTKRTVECLGCSKDEFIKYIELLFSEGMSWDNYGEWHIDHIIPLSTAKDDEDVYRLNHYSNLQPLWKEDNIKKSNKVI